MRDPCHRLHEGWGIAEFQRDFPDLRLAHESDCGISFCGEVSFRASLDGTEEIIEDAYSLRGEVTARFPSELPLVFEVGGRIPKNFHTNPGKDLCLGSPLALRVRLEPDRSLSGFVKNLIIPYLFNHSYLERFGNLPLGELVHGRPGLVADYERIFNVAGAQNCIEMLKLLGMKKRLANKCFCPCGSGKRLGKCHNFVLNPLRKIEHRSFFLKEARNLGDVL